MSHEMTEEEEQEAQAQIKDLMARGEARSTNPEYQRLTLKFCASQTLRLFRKDPEPSSMK